MVTSAAAPRRTSRPAPANEGEYSAKEIYGRVLRQARPYAPHITGILVLSLASTPLALLAPVPLQIAVDSVLGPHPLPPVLTSLVPGGLAAPGSALLLVAVLTVLIAVLSGLRGIANGVLRTYTGQRLAQDFRGDLFRHAQRLSLAYHDERGTSDSTYRIQYDAPAVQWIAVDGVIPFVGSVVKLVTMIYVTALIDPTLALIALAFAPVLFVITRIGGRQLRSEWRGARKLDSSIMSGVQEALGAVRVVKAFGQEDNEHERFASRAGEWVRARTRLAVTEGLFGLASGTAVAAGTATVLYVGVSHVEAGSLTLGQLLLVMSYLAGLYRPLEKISEKLGDVQRSLVSAERAFTLLDERPDVPERPHARPIRRAAGAVAFERVSFAYDPDAPVLQEISLRVEPGERLGIAGSTGAGKTTLVSLLTRFYDPSSGAILLDGRDLRDYRLSDLRNQFAIVLQEPVLFSNSVAENIGYARPGAHLADIVRAARAADAHRFISGLPDGYDTRVGERGMRLSGGERQRISLARAFLKDAPILILDEPTSSVDTATEAAILEAMEDLMHGRTTFMIAHRLSTLDGCDVRLRIEGGRVVDFGRSSGAGARSL